MRSKANNEVFASDVASSQQDLLAVVNALQTPVVVVNEQGLILFRNAAAAIRFGVATQLIEAMKGIRSLEASGDLAQQITSAIKSKAVHVFHGMWLDDAAKQTEHKYISIHVSPLNGGYAKKADVSVIAIHTHEMSDTHATHDVAERLVQLGGLTAKIAHELNNPLDGILRYVNLSLRLLSDGDDPRLKNYLSESRTGLMRMVQIISELLQYSRRTEGAFDESDVNEIVEQAIRNVSPAAEQNGIVVAADFQTRNMPVARGSRLYQICCNLLKNAVEAMPGGGRLTITCGVHHENVIIQVADTGMGLPADTSRLFEPFYSTKAVGKGTGLGLAICKDFVEEMKGTITATNGEEGGAVFSVQIPVASFHTRTSFHSANRRDPVSGPINQGMKE